MACRTCNIKYENPLLVSPDSSILIDDSEKKLKPYVEICEDCGRKYYKYPIGLQVNPLSKSDTQFSASSISLAITPGGVKGHTPNIELVPSNDAGNILILGSDGYPYVSGPGLPDQTGNNGKWLQTNGTVASWETLTIPPTPSLQDVTDIGSITTNVLTAASLVSISDLTIGNNLGSGDIHWYNSNNNIVSVLSNPGNLNANLWTLPDDSGTLVLSVNTIFADSFGDISLNLGDLLDIFGSPSDGDVLYWNNTNSRYEYSSIDTIIGYTPYDASNPLGFIDSSALSGYLTSSAAALAYTPLTRNLTINGVTQDLSADRTWTISSLPTQTGNNGKFLTTDGTNASWATVSSPSAANPTATLGLTAVNGSASTYMRSDAAPALSQAITPTWTGLHTFNPTFNASGGVANGVIVNPILTATANADKLRGLFINPSFSTGGNVNVGFITLKLRVGTGATGMQLISGENSAGTEVFGVDSSGAIKIGNTLNTISGSTTNGVYISNQFTASYNAIQSLIVNAASPTTGNRNILLFSHSNGGFQPTSGTATLTGLRIEPVINQTGTSSGAIRGIYYNPTLTGLLGTHTAYESTTGNTLFGTTSGSVGIGANTSINASAILDITSTTKGLLLPRMTGVQAEAISSPANGLLIYCNNGNGSTITSIGFWGYAGSWVKLN